MAIIKNAVDIALRATSPRTVPANLPSNIIVPWGQIPAGTGKAADNATVGADGSNLKVGTGGNLIPNSDFSAGKGNWRPGWHSNPDNTGAGVENAAWNFGNNGISTLPPPYNVPPLQFNTIGAVRWGSTGAAAGYYDIELNELIPVSPNTRYEYSAYMATKRCGASLSFIWLDSVGNVIPSSETHIEMPHAIGETTGGNLGLGGGAESGYTVLANWSRVGGFFTSPSNAASIYIFIRGNPVQGAEMHALFQATRIFFAQAGAAQTELSPWSGGSSTGNFSTLSKITIGNVSTYIADKSIDKLQIANLAVDTAQIANLAVNTLQIAGDAVTIPISSYTGAPILTNTTAWTIIQSATILSTGAPIAISASCTFNSSVCISPYLLQYFTNVGALGWQWVSNLKLKRDGIELVSYSGVHGFWAGSYAETPGAGWHTYTLEVLVSNMATAGNGYVAARFLGLMETKK